MRLSSQIDPSEAEIGRNRGVAVGIAGDVEATPSATDGGGFQAYMELNWIGLASCARRAGRGVSTWNRLRCRDAPMHAMYVHKAVMQILQPDDYLVFDGGDYCHFGRAYLPALDA